jgi:hypothetical protein
VVLGVVVVHKLLPQRTGQYSLIALFEHWLTANTLHSGGCKLQFNVSQSIPVKKINFFKFQWGVNS